MGFAKLIERLYLKVFVGMAASHSGISVVVELVKNGEVKERTTRRFDFSRLRLVERRDGGDGSRRFSLPLSR